MPPVRGKWFCRPGLQKDPSGALEILRCRMDTFRSPRQTTFLRWRFFLAPVDYSASYLGHLQIPNSIVDQRSIILNFLLNRQYQAKK